MKKSLPMVGLCFLLLILGCGNIKLPGISSSSDATPTPSTPSNTVANTSTVTNTVPTDSANTTIGADAPPAGDEYADVPEAECRLYLATLKTLSECKTFTDKQRQDFAKIYTDTLKSSKAPAKTKELGDLKDSICKMTNEAMKPTADKCRVN